jgi:hypothetical protein
MPAAAASRPTKRCDKCGACRLPSDALNCAPAETRLLWPGRLRDERQRGPSRSRSDRCGLDAGRQSRQAEKARQEQKTYGVVSVASASVQRQRAAGRASGFRVAPRARRQPQSARANAARPRPRPRPRPRNYRPPLQKLLQSGCISAACEVKRMLSASDPVNPLIREPIGLAVQLAADVGELDELEA